MSHYHRFCTFLVLLLIAPPVVGPSAFAQTLTLTSKAVQHIDASGDEFVYFNLSDALIVTPEAAGFGGWDIAFQGTNIKVNGASQLLDQSYEEMTVAPEEGYTLNEDGTSELPSGSDSGWFSYDFNTHVISPAANKTIVLKTHDGKYCKIEITDYYKVVFTENGPAPTPRYYSFRFTLQADGSGAFE
ncbi:MAG: HmuY family protein [Rhodothermales bacterium]|nr:HmuY family protein [Rhodothermales bacterium]MDG2015969.1 HmuY family protein [Rhodothermales bacterium]HAY36492.1 hypothetical protein [Bacteroidota bacterium]